MKIGIGIGIDKQQQLSSAPAAPTVSGVTISGGQFVGGTLTASYTLGGGTASTITRRWYRGATLISTSTTVDTYTPVQADAGNTSNIKCNVEVSNITGSANADSNVLARILDALTNTYITGLTLTSGEIDSFNTLYLALRSNNYHTEFDRLHIWSSATQAASNKSLFGSFTGVPVNSPTWTRKVGYTHTGTSYIATGYTPSTHGVKHSLNDNSYVIGFNNLPNGSDSMLGGATSAAQPSGLTLYSNTLNLLVRDYATGNVTAFTNRLLSDTYAAVVRTSSTSITSYLNASTVVTSNTVNNPLVNLECFSGGRNLSGAASLLMTSGSISRYDGHGSSNINPTTLNTIIANFIASL